MKEQPLQSARITPEREYIQKRYNGNIKKYCKAMRPLSASNFSKLSTNIERIVIETAERTIVVAVKGEVK